MLKREFSAGGTVFKKLPIINYQSPITKTKILWLVTRSTPSNDYPKAVWRLPKGWLDDINNGKNPGSLTSGEKRATEDDLQETALREVAEEGGIKAKIIKKVSTERFFLF